MYKDCVLVAVDFFVDNLRNFVHNAFASTVSYCFSMNAPKDLVLQSELVLAFSVIYLYNFTYC